MTVQLLLPTMSFAELRAQIARCDQAAVAVPADLLDGKANIPDEALLQRDLSHARHPVAGPQTTEEVRFASWLAYYDGERGYYREALARERQALPIHQRELGPDHPPRWQVQNALPVGPAVQATSARHCTYVGYFSPTSSACSAPTIRRRSQLGCASRSLKVMGDGKTPRPERQLWVRALHPRRRHEMLHVRACQASDKGNDTASLARETLAVPAGGRWLHLIGAYP